MVTRERCTGYWLHSCVQVVKIHQAIFKDVCTGTSLVVQWLRIHLSMLGTRVRALVQEDPTCRGATRPVCHNY